MSVLNVFKRGCISRNLQLFKLSGAFSNVHTAKLSSAQHVCDTLRGRHYTRSGKTPAVNSTVTICRWYSTRPGDTRPKHLVDPREYERDFRRSLDDPEGFWGEAAEHVTWFKKWDKVMDDSNSPYTKW